MAAGSRGVEAHLPGEGRQGRRVRAEQTELDRLRRSRIRPQILQMAAMGPSKWSRFSGSGVVFNVSYPLFHKSLVATCSHFLFKHLTNNTFLKLDTFFMSFLIEYIVLQSTECAQVHKSCTDIFSGMEFILYMWKMLSSTVYKRV